MDYLVTDRSDRGKLRFTGPQDAWFLHQILTQEFEEMPVGEARDAAQITAHGKMVGYLEFLRIEDGFLAHFEPSLKGNTYPEQIARYVFATQVEIQDASEDFGLLLAVGDGWESFVRGCLPDALLQPTRSLGAPAGYVWVPVAEKEEVLSALVSAGAQKASEEELEAVRVAHGAPRWGKEMNERSLPQESGVDAWAVHYDKGCYVGQEAMAKIHFRGKVNRHLVKLEGTALKEGVDVLLDGQKVGEVTSAVDGKALAIVRAAVEVGALVETDGREAKVVA